MPKEVIFEVFNNTDGKTFVSNPSDGDTYIVDVEGFTMLLVRTLLLKS